MSRTQLAIFSLQDCSWPLNNAGLNRPGPLVHRYFSINFVELTHMLQRVENCKACCSAESSWLIGFSPIQWVTSTWFQMGPQGSWLMFRPGKRYECPGECKLLSCHPWTQKCGPPSLQLDADLGQPTWDRSQACQALLWLKSSHAPSPRQLGLCGLYVGIVLSHYPASSSSIFAPILLPLFKPPGSNFPWMDGENCDTMLNQQLSKLKIQHLNHLWGLLKNRVLGPFPRVSHSLGLRWILRTCILNKFLSDAMGPGTILREIQY